MVSYTGESSWIHGRWTVGGERVEERCDIYSLDGVIIASGAARVAPENPAPHWTAAPPLHAGIHAEDVMKPVPGKSRSEAFSKLLDRLREAAARHSEDGRDGAIHAVNSVAAFLLDFQEVNKEGLAIPLLNLAGALNDLDNGIRTPMLSKSTGAGRNKRSTSRRYLIAEIAAVRELMVQKGYRQKEAAKMIAERLNRIGVKNLGFGGLRAPITQTTVQNWCNEFLKSSGNSGPGQSYIERVAMVKTDDKAPKAEFGAFALNMLENIAKVLRTADEGPQ
jgi:hypothetical protein